MKRRRTYFPTGVFLIAFILALTCFAGWGQEYVEASGIGLAPRSIPPAQARAMARRAAIADLRYRLAIRLGNGDPRGHIRGIEILGEAWDGANCKISGRVRADGFTPAR